MRDGIYLVRNIIFFPSSICYKNTLQKISPTDESLEGTFSILTSPIDIFVMIVILWLEFCFRMNSILELHGIFCSEIDPHYISISYLIIIIKMKHEKRNLFQAWYLKWLIFFLFIPFRNEFVGKPWSNCTAFWHISLSTQKNTYQFWLLLWTWLQTNGFQDILFQRIQLNVSLTRRLQNLLYVNNWIRMY